MFKNFKNWPTIYKILLFGAALAIGFFGGRALNAEEPQRQLSEIMKDLIIDGAEITASSAGVAGCAASGNISIAIALTILTGVELNHAYEHGMELWDHYCNNENGIDGVSGGTSCENSTYDHGRD